MYTMVVVCVPVPWGVGGIWAHAQRHDARVYGTA